MPSSRPVLLLTGFGPFPRVPVNATSLLVPRIAEAADKTFAGLSVVCEIIPTEWHAGLERVEELYVAHRPVVAIHFGVSSRTLGFAVEARARNCCAASPDAAGCLPNGDCIAPGAPAFLPSKLPVTLIVERVRRRGIPAQLSRDAGNYLCNALMYRTLDLARGGDWPARNGFVHLPTSLVDPRNPERGPLASSPLSWSQVIDGGLEIIAASLGRQRSRSQVSPSPPAWAGA
ncbi:MAG: pyroglutamyl-peptidase I [Hyphomicrobiaceae bacterium]